MSNNKEGMVVQDVDFDHSAPIVVSVDLNLDDDEVAIGGVTAAGPRILYRAIDDGTGKGFFPVVGFPIGTITSPDDTPLPAVPGAVALAVPPVGTRRMTVQVTDGGATTRIRIREVGGSAGAGRLLTLLASTMYGGADGAITALEAEWIAGPASAVSVTFEG
jgi:hypothetical protein